MIVAQAINALAMGVSIIIIIISNTY